MGLASMVIFAFLAALALVVAALFSWRARAGLRRRTQEAARELDGTLADVCGRLRHALERAESVRARAPHEWRRGMQLDAPLLSRAHTTAFRAREADRATVGVPTSTDGGQGISGDAR